MICITPPLKELAIVWREQDLVAIFKPSGYFIHKTQLGAHEQPVMQVLRDQLDQWVYPIHRLDRGTSGLCLFALNSEKAARMAELFSTRQVEKTYHAIVRGHLKGEQEIEDTLEDKTTGKVQEAASTVTPLAWMDRFSEDLREMTLVRIRPKTGRRHQIRRHLRRLHHPIIGDTTYGDSKLNIHAAKIFGVKRLLLVATGLNWQSESQTNRIHCNLDEDLKEILKNFQWNWSERLTQSGPKKS